MVRRLLLLAVVLLVLTSPLYAGFSQAQDFRMPTPAELALESAPNAPGMPAVILDWVEVDDDANSAASTYFRIKVLTAEGKKFGDVEVPYMATYPWNGRVADISARTIRPDGSIVPFDGKVFDKVVYKSRRGAVRAKAFSLADVQPGSILEYRYQVRWSQNLITNTEWILQRDVPVMHAKMTLKPFDTRGEFSSFFTYMGLPAGKIPVKSHDAYDLELTDIPAFRSEELAPPEGQLKPHVNFYYTSSRVKPTEFWSVEAATLGKKIEKFIGSSATARIDAQQWAAAGAPAEKLRKIYAEIQAFRNYTYEASKSDAELAKQSIESAKNAEAVLSAHAGYATELNRAFVAVAREAGFDAAVARVAPRDEGFFSDKIPDGDQMSDEIALVTVDGQSLHLDPGTPGAPFGIVSWEKTNVPAIRIAKGGAPVWGTIPSDPPSSAVTRRSADLKLNDDVLEGTVTASFIGQEALVRRLKVAASDEAAQKKSIEDEVKGWFPDGVSLTLKTLTGLGKTDEPLTAVFEAKLPNIVSRAGSRVLLAPSIFAAGARNPFAAETRSNMIYFPYQRREEDEVKVTLPEGLSPVVLPAPAKLTAGTLAYSNEVKADGSTLTFNRKMDVSTMLVEAKYYGALRGFYVAMATADQKPLILTQAK